MLHRTRNHRLVAVSLAGLAFWTLSMPRPAAAAWHDQSEDLPGTISGTTILLIGLGTAAAVTVVALAVHSRHQSDTPKAAAVPTDSSSSHSVSGSLLLPQIPSAFAPLFSPNLGTTHGQPVRSPIAVGVDPNAKSVLVGISAGF